MTELQSELYFLNYEWSPLYNLALVVAEIFAKTPVRNNEEVNYCLCEWETCVIKESNVMKNL